ncbi:hypothetical protein J2Y69_002387 [Microbacterium resistens]|uniref:DUF1905 domain-containing protein n=1 Tax=Microbacterium resistens TaxID=156977 RepID=A0ABU1SDU6_9MICO|nr:DUF1905 domain-containing protein [Microbacterium resistens]MDR6867779.1 hypothetical protein [Microbacterium resistens]
MQIEFDAEVQRWDARTDSWYFAVIPEELSADIRELPAPPRGFGALRVRVRVGATRWSTSIFFSRGTYSLPLKRAVRDAEGIAEGDVITIELEIVDL